MKRLEGIRTCKKVMKLILGNNDAPYHYRKNDEFLWNTRREDQDHTIGYNDPYLGYRLRQNYCWYCPCVMCSCSCENTCECIFTYNLIIPIDQLNLNARV